MDDKEEEFKSLMKPYFDDITKHLMKGIEWLASELGGKLAAGSSNSSHHEEKKTYRETIFSKTQDHNKPNEFKNNTIPTIPKFFIV